MIGVRSISQNLYLNGFVVKSYEEEQYPQQQYHYRGIGRYRSWPLEHLKDDQSREISRFAYETWFAYSDDRFEVIPSRAFIKRYVEHCNTLGIQTFIIQIESTCDILQTTERGVLVETLGFDYAGGDLQSSCLYYDMIDYKEIKSYALFDTVKRKLNRNGLLNTIKEMYEYLEIREKLMEQGYEFEEELYQIFPMKLSIVKL